MRVTSRRLAAAVVPLLAACRTAGPGSSSPRTAEQEVLAAERDWVNVTLKQDADAFASFLHDEWVGLSDDGTWIEKAPWTRSIRTRTTHYDAVKISNLVVRFPRPDVSVVTGDFMQKGVSGARDNSMVGRYVDTWARIGGRWQLVSSGFAPRPGSAATPGGTGDAGERAAADERAIRDIIAHMPRIRDVDEEAMTYAPDAWFLSTRTPEPLVGREARRADIARRRAPAADEATVIEPARVVVGAAGDIAYDYGMYRTTWTEVGRPQDVRGYYLRTWRKEGARWLSTAESVQRRPLPPAPAPTAAEPPHAGRLLAPGPHEGLKFCASPGLSVRLLVDSIAVGPVPFAMGTAAIAPGGTNAGVHPAEDEATYFLRGEGRAFIGADTVSVTPGLVAYVPRGVRHGFISTGSSPLEFLWVVSPPGLASRFRETGLAADASCPPRTR